MFSVTTVCHKTSDTALPLLMLTNREGNRYFIGKVPEGSQRVLNENGYRLGKVKSIFLTGIISTWSDLGGLPGLFLTISDATGRGLDIFTNALKILTYVVATWRFFVFRRGSSLNILEAKSPSVIGDGTAAFFPVSIEPDSSEQFGGENGSENVGVKNEPVTIKLTCQEANTPNLSTPNHFPSLNKLISLMFPSSQREKLISPSSEIGKTEIQTHVLLPEISNITDASNAPSLSYVIRFLPVRGKFDPVKAKELGVKPGVDFRNLTNGQRVLNEKNEWIEPSQVLGKPKTLPKLVIIDIPSSAYLSNTLSSPEWFVKSENHGYEEPGLVYHFLGDDVDFRLDDYLSFILKFPSGCTHVLSHSSISTDTLMFKTHAVHLLKLKTILNKNFNLPYMEISKVPTDTEPFEPSLQSKIEPLKSLQSFKIEPTGVTYESSVSTESWDTLYDQNVKENPGSCVTKKEVLENEVIPLPGTPVVGQLLKELVLVITLGTGSAIPSLHRNVLSNIVRIPRICGGSIVYSTMLLDGGENTLGAMMRNFGHNNKEQMKQILLELSVIYLSHLHADHHLGIVSVINMWMDHNRDNMKKLYLIIPWQYNTFLKEWYSLEKQTRNADLSRICYISCEDFMDSPELEFKPLTLQAFSEDYDGSLLGQGIVRTEPKRVDRSILDQLFKDTGIRTIQTVRAIHCQWSYCASIDIEMSEEESFKISFSGDTRPNPRFINIGQNTDLLIHEASLDNDHIEEALAKRHTTIVEAVHVSQLMGCKKLILTHFSSRFSERHQFIESAEQYGQLSDSLKEYLGNSTSNVFLLPKSNDFSFDDLDICYAYDFMNVQWNDIGCQKGHYSAINELSTSEETEVTRRREERDHMKRTEKREEKRKQRLTTRKRKLGQTEP